MKLKIAYLFIISLVVFAACKKGPAPFTGVKINTLKDFRSGALSTYTYNEDGSVSVITKTGLGKTQYYYDGDTVVLSDINNASVTTDGFQYITNSNGWATSATGQLQYQNNSYGYSYDVNGILDQQKYYTQGNLVAQDDYVKGNGDIANIKHSTFNIVTGNTVTYDYYNYFISNTNAIGVQNKGQYYLGVSTTHLVDMDVKIGNTGDTADIITYKYRYDGNSNVDTMVSYRRNGQLLDSMGFTYY